MFKAKVNRFNFNGNSIINRVNKNIANTIWKCFTVKTAISESIKDFETNYKPVDDQEINKFLTKYDFTVNTNNNNKSVIELNKTYQEYQIAVKFFLKLSNPNPSKILFVFI